MEIRITPFIVNRPNTNLNKPEKRQVQLNQPAFTDISKPTKRIQLSVTRKTQSQIPASNLKKFELNTFTAKRSFQPLVPGKSGLKSSLINNLQQPALNEQKGIALYRQIERNKLFSTGPELLNQLEYKV